MVPAKHAFPRINELFVQATRVPRSGGDTVMLTVGDAATVYTDIGRATLFRSLRNTVTDTSTAEAPSTLAT